jgi:uncharacterized Fe-S cluster protein YjdI
VTQFDRSVKGDTSTDGYQFKYYKNNIINIHTKQVAQDHALCVKGRGEVMVFVPRPPKNQPITPKAARMPTMMPATTRMASVNGITMTCQYI